MQIKIDLDKTEKWIDKRRYIDPGYADCFRLVNLSKSGKTAEILWLEADEIGRTETRRPIFNYIKLKTENKRIIYADGKMIISVFGLKYQIGTYTEL